MNKQFVSVFFAILLLGLAIQGCAGGSRGTGMRFNSDAKSSPLDDDDDDDDEPVLLRRR